MFDAQRHPGIVTVHQKAENHIHIFKAADLPEEACFHTDPKGSKQPILSVTVTQAQGRQDGRWNVAAFGPGNRLLAQSSQDSDQLPWPVNAR